MVSISNPTNAGIMAVRILLASDAEYRQVMTDFMRGMGDEVEAKTAKLQEIGWKVYLEK